MAYGTESFDNDKGQLKLLEIVDVESIALARCQGQPSISSADSPCAEMFWIGDNGMWLKQMNGTIVTPEEPNNNDEM